MWTSKNRAFGLAVAATGCLIAFGAGCGTTDHTQCPQDEDLWSPVVVGVFSTDDDTPIAGATVALNSPNSDNPGGDETRMTDEYGRAVFCGVDPAPYDIEVHTEEWVFYRSIDHGLFLTETTVYTQHDSPIEEQGLGDACPHDTTGDDLLQHRVHVISNGLPPHGPDLVAGATVELRGSQTFGPLTTDLGGTVTFCDVPSGDYVIATRHDGVLQQRPVSLGTGLNGVKSLVYFGGSAAQSSP